MEVMDLWTLQIEHDYYQQGKTSDFDIHISPDMRILLMRRSLIWRRKGVNEWCLSSFGDYSVDSADVLRLELIMQGETLPYVTDFDWSVGRECYDVAVPVGNRRIAAKECVGKKTIAKTNSCCMKLSVPFGKMINENAFPATMILSFQTISRYWEYLLLPRQPQLEKKLRLEDTKNYIHFTSCEDFEFMGHKSFKARSLEKFPLRERYENIHLVLWETISIRDVQKERMLLQGLPFPEPSLKVGIAPETVWRILYY